MLGIASTRAINAKKNINIRHERLRMLQGDIEMYIVWVGYRVLAVIKIVQSVYRRNAVILILHF